MTCTIIWKIIFDMRTSSFSDFGWVLVPNQHTAVNMVWTYQIFYVINIIQLLWFELSNIKFLFEIIFILKIKTHKFQDEVGSEMVYMDGFIGWRCCSILRNVFVLRLRKQHQSIFSNRGRSPSAKFFLMDPIKSTSHSPSLDASLF